MIRKLIARYAHFVSHHTYSVLIVLLIITAAAFQLSQNVGTVSEDNSDMIPDELPVMQAFEVLEDSFGGSQSVMIAVETDPQVPGSDEVRDLRDPEVIEYLYLLARMAQHTDDVTSSNSLGTLLYEMNNKVLPKSKRAIMEHIEANPMSSTYITDDYSMALVRISLSDSYDDQEIADDLRAIVDQVPMPAGVKARVAGEVITGPVVMEQIGPDMARTSRFSIIGILIVLFLLFMSPRYALTPLVVIGVGITWAFGYFGLMGMDLSSTTSGAVSMIMGIGIDFGIQTINRFRQELREKKAEKAMETTLNAVFMPMATTTIAALIGFKAMSMGDLTVLSELATMMGYGVLACFLAAVSIIPVIAIIGENLTDKIKRGLRWKEG